MRDAAHRTADAPLWQKLQAVAQVVSAVRHGGSTTAALEQTKALLRPGVQALSFQALRNMGRAQALRSKLAPRLPPPAADALLCSSLALGWDLESAPFDPHTLVNQTVEAAKRHTATKIHANFINACLRRFLREQEFLIASTNSEETALWNHPVWWIERLKADYPADWKRILQANNNQAPMTLRVNQSKISRDAYLALLASATIAAKANGKYGVTLASARPVLAIPGFAEGLVSVQDAAAQMAVPLLLESLQSDNNLRVLDACAAPGGKTAQLLELARHEITSIDIDGDRLQKIQQTFDRLGLRSKLIVGDAANPNSWWDGQPFDAILLDAPCTASGIVRRHPDVRWLRRESDIDQLARVQARLLDALWPLLRPGGRMLYCTCSVFHAEGSSQIQTFLTHNTDAILMPSPGHLLPHLAANPEVVPDNSSDDHDGFYLALLEKRTD